MAYNAEQQKNINLILSIVKQRGLPPQAAQIALMTAMVEAGLMDHAGASTDHDSGGLFQQRPSAGWGTYQQVRDPVYATNKFLDHLTQLPGWQTMQPGAAAQAVQGSAFPERYQEHFGEASSIMQSAWPGARPYSGEMTHSMASTDLSGASPSLTPAQKQAALQDGAGPLYALAQAVPELKDLISQAISSGWTAADFQNKVTNSKWYRTHSDAVRTSIVLQQSDPATYKQQLTAAGHKVSTLMKQMGVAPGTMTNAQYVGLAKQVQMGSITDAELQQQLASHFGAGTGKYGQHYTQNGLQGQAAVYDQQLREVYSQYGQSPQPGQIAYRVKQLLSGTATVDQYKQQAIVAAKAMYPGLAQSLDSGLTVKDVAQPYVQSYSQLLELNPNTVSIGDPRIRAALQGVPNSKGVRSATSITDFENQLRTDPRWMKTQNAHQDFATALSHVGQDWGFN